MPQDHASPTLPDPDYDQIAAERPYPYQELIGFQIVEWRENYAVVALDVANKHYNRHGIPHGGVIATLLDTSFGFASCWCPYPGRVRRAMTLSLTLNYVGQLKGTTMRATAWVTGGGRRSFFAAGKIEDDTGALLATASAAMRWRGNGGDPMGDPLER